MKGYHYDIIYENEKWYFRLVPGNKGKQDMGKSIGYNSKSECLAAKEKFQSMVIAHKDNISECTILINNENGYFYTKFIMNGEVVFLSRKIESKANRNKNLQRIIDHISAVLDNDNK